MNNGALALLEFSGPAAGLLAADRMLKRSPIAMLRCGTVHPGRFLTLIGGTVGAVVEAFAEGTERAVKPGELCDAVLLPDPEPQLVAALGGGRVKPRQDAVGIMECVTSTGLLRALDAVLKAVPVTLVEARLADDLGGRALGIVDGLLPDVQQALSLAPGVAGEGQLAAASLLSNLDETLREVLAAGTEFRTCAPLQPAGAEIDGGD